VKFERHEMEGEGQDVVEFKCYEIKDKDHEMKGEGD